MQFEVLMSTFNFIVPTAGLVATAGLVSIVRRPGTFTGARAMLACALLSAGRSVAFMPRAQRALVSDADSLAVSVFGYRAVEDVGFGWSLASALIVVAAIAGCSRLLSRRPGSRQPSKLLQVAPFVALSVGAFALCQLHGLWSRALVDDFSNMTVDSLNRDASFWLRVEVIASATVLILSAHHFVISNIRSATPTRSH